MPTPTSVRYIKDGDAINGLDDRISQVQTQMDTILAALRPHPRAHYSAGGGHRLWIIDSARRMADKISPAMKLQYEGLDELFNPLPGRNSAEVGLPVLIYRINVPQPPDWEGTRPPQTSAINDFRHYKDSLRYRLAMEKFLFKVLRVADDFSHFIIQVQPVVLCAMLGWADDTASPAELDSLGQFGHPSLADYETYTDLATRVFGGESSSDSDNDSESSSEEENPTNMD